MTLFFANSEITIYRARFKGSNKYTYSATGTVQSADIQPLDPNRVEAVGGRVFKTWRAYVDTSVDVKEGDQIVSGGVRYGVQGVSKWEGAGLLDHYELIITSQDGQ